MSRGSVPPSVSGLAFPPSPRLSWRERPDLLDEFELVEVEVLQSDVALLDQFHAHVPRRDAVAARRNVALCASECAGMGRADMIRRRRM